MPGVFFGFSSTVTYPPDPFWQSRGSLTHSEALTYVFTCFSLQLLSAVLPCDHHECGRGPCEGHFVPLWFSPEPCQCWSDPGEAIFNKDTRVLYPLKEAYAKKHRPASKGTFVRLI